MKINPSQIDKLYNALAAENASSSSKESEKQAAIGSADSLSLSEAAKNRSDIDGAGTWWSRTVPRPPRRNAFSGSRARSRTEPTASLRSHRGSDAGPCPRRRLRRMKDVSDLARILEGQLSTYRGCSTWKREVAGAD
jgi:hypothetical protein